VSELFTYQLSGYAWLAGRPRALLADEPGLGKTAQAIVAADAACAEQVCVVAPASVVANWRREIERWSLGLWDYDILSYDAAVRRGLPKADTYIIDEAHYAKTLSAKRTKVLIGAGSPLHDAARVWALSGTPAPNHVGELYSWLAFFRAHEGLSYRKFLDRYTNWQMTDFGPKVWGNKKAAMPELQAKLQGVMLRRLKRDVLKDLPAVRWGDISLVGNVGSFDNQLANNILISDTLPGGDDEHIASLRRAVGDAKAGPLASFIADELEGSGEKIVVFAWHKSVLDTLEAALAKFGVARIDGGTPSAKRQGIVDRFQADPACRVFLGNIIAAGIGITLTAASSLIFAEMSWTPGDNGQAAMRVHRIGQTQPVLIRTATLRGSIDEAVNAVLARKTKALDQLYEKEAA
jgi:SWI/SNF-related matrix-associated actin-dependent regulator 1 of chromatin subfamily A